MDRRHLSLVKSSWLLVAAILSTHCHAARSLENELEPTLEMVVEHQRHETSAEGVHAGNLGDEASDYVNAHNNARRAVRANIPDLVWSSTLANFAKNWAQTRANSGCDLIHSGGPYGENLYLSSRQSSPAEAVDSWVAEKQYYNYNSNSCSNGEFGCLHYTQVVWKKTQSVGCGSATCSSGKWKGGKFVVCSYDPQGNMNRERPY